MSKDGLWTVIPRVTRVALDSEPGRQVFTVEVTRTEYLSRNDAEAPKGDVPDDITTALLNWLASPIQ